MTLRGLVNCSAGGLCPGRGRFREFVQQGSSSRRTYVGTLLLNDMRARCLVVMLN